MRLVVAPDKFKGSLTAEQAADAISRGVLQAWPKAQITQVPIADGGEGTLRALVRATGGKLLRQRVMGPLGNPVVAHYGILGDGKTAVVEMAEASGYRLVPASKRNPLITTTYGTGELILAALRRGCRRLIVGIGGSATNDGGAGMIQALGARLLDSKGREIRPGIGGGSLNCVADIDLSEFAIPASLSTLVASDVRNPLVGRRGASAVFGPQKGATPAMVRELDANLTHWAKLVAESGAVSNWRALASFPGGGAAGGLGAGLRAFLRADFRPGIEIVIEHAHLADALKRADLVITGEGCLDRSTLDGKAPSGVAALAKKLGVPVLGIGGSIDGSAVADFRRAGFDAVLPLLTGPISLDEAMARASELLTVTTTQALQLTQLGTKLQTRKSKNRN